MLRIIEDFFKVLWFLFSPEGKDKHHHIVSPTIYFQEVCVLLLTLEELTFSFVWVNPCWSYLKCFRRFFIVLSHLTMPCFQGSFTL